ncbi:MAG: hypothetical protein HYR84_03710 [Planctomycetes bacterium]|nr:hypothetical protein [Planctomycetota bacterium]
MKYGIPGFALVLILASVHPAEAQLFAKKPKVNPSQRVPELIVIVKTDPDEKKRAHAAEELRDFDVTKFTEIVPVLVDVLPRPTPPAVNPTFPRPLPSGVADPAKKTPQAQGPSLFP